MPEAERLTYTVTPGPEVLAKMGTSWTLFASPPVMFTVGPDGEPPEPAAVTMTAEQAADLASSGYVVEEALAAAPEPVNDVQVSPGLEGVEPEPVNDVRVVAEEPGAETFVRDEARRVEQEREEQRDLITGTSAKEGVFVGTGENMPGPPAEGIQAEPGTQADGSPTEPVKRRKT